MDSTLLNTAIGVPVIVGLTQMFKQAFNVSENKVPLMSLGIALALGVAVFFSLPGLTVLTVLTSAIISALAANGLYNVSGSVGALLAPSPEKASAPKDPVVLG